jgi:uncharacterized RDD family membrane protein YckC
VNRIACPHCGFLNFSISAYCGRCERPLVAGETPAPDRIRPSPTHPPAARPPTAMPIAARPTPPTAIARPAAPAAMPIAATPVPPALTAQSAATPLPAPAVASFVPRPQARPPTPPAAAPAPKPTPTKPEVPPPAPPVQVADVAPVLIPIELPKPAAPPRAAPAAVELDNEPTPPDVEPRRDEGSAVVPIEIITQPAHGWRLWAGRAIDLAIVVLIGVVAALVTAAVEGGDWEPRGVWIVDYLAEWTYAHPGAAFSGLVAALLFGFLYSLGFGLVSGRTVGRYVVDTELVSEDGGRPGILPLLVRSAVGVASFLAFGAGHFWSVVDRERRSWHDRLSHTVVVHRRGLDGSATTAVK